MLTILIQKLKNLIMKNIIKPAIFFLFSIVVLSSCSKYADGPKFSLLSKKSRLCGGWVVEKALYNSNDVTSTYVSIVGSNFVLEIEKDGGYRTEGPNPDTGKWALGEDKDDVRLTSNAGGSTETSFRILRLKSKELWLKQTLSNGDIQEVHYKAK